MALAASLDRKPIILSLAAIAVLGLALYANSLGGSFVMDDYLLVKENYFLGNLGYVQKAMSGVIANGILNEYSFYRPLQMLSYMIDHAIGGVHPFMYHLTSVMLHIFAAWLVFWLMMVLFKDRFTALVTALLFISYPVQAEAVAYISGRSDPLGLVFLLLTFILYVRYVDREDIVSAFLCVDCYILAVLARENAVIFPLLIALYHGIFRKRVRPALVAQIVAMTAIYLVLRATVLSDLLIAAKSQGVTTLLQRLPGVFAAFATYARLLVLPAGLHMEYGLRFFRFYEPSVIIGCILLAATLYACVMAWRKGERLIAFGLCWFLIGLLPVSNLYPINAFMAEHWLYAPSIGIFLIAADLCRRLMQRKDLERPVLAVLAIVLVAYGVMTIRQNYFWSDPIRFYERTLKFAPMSARVHNNLANEFYLRGDRAAALPHYEKALLYDPAYVQAYNNIGAVYSDLGRYDEAARSFQKALELSPQYAGAYSNLANVYRNNGKVAEAIALYQRSLEANPYSANTYFNLGLALGMAREHAKAIAAFTRVTEIDPGFAPAYHNMGSAFYIIGDKEKAMALYRKALALEPKYVEAYRNLAKVQADLGKADDAVASCRKAIALNPSDPAGYYDLGVTYTILGKPEAAIGEYKKALELAPRFIDALVNMGILYNGIGKKEEALAAFSKAIECDPKFAPAYKNIALVHYYAGDLAAAREYYLKAKELGLTDEKLEKLLASS